MQASLRLRSSGVQGVRGVKEGKWRIVERARLRGRGEQGRRCGRRIVWPRSVT